MSAHEGDCDGTFCDFCGCCEHGEYSEGCQVYSAPQGLQCAGVECGCEGQGFYQKPERAPARAVSPSDAGPAGSGPSRQGPGRTPAPEPSEHGGTAHSTASPARHPEPGDSE